MLHESVASAFEQGTSIALQLQQTSKQQPSSAILQAAVQQHGSAASQAYMQGCRHLDPGTARRLSSCILSICSAGKRARDVGEDCRHASASFCRLAERQHAAFDLDQPAHALQRQSCILEAAMLAAQVAEGIQMESQTVQAACSALHLEVAADASEQLIMVLRSQGHGWRTLLPALKALKAQLDSELAGTITM